MSGYTAIGVNTFRGKAGTLAEKLVTEFGLIDDEIDVHKSKFACLTPNQGTITALATTGADLASGSDYVLYGVFVAPVAMTIIKMHDYLTEAYVKEGSDAIITVKDDAASPTTIATRTLTAAGEAAKAFHSTTPASATIAAGTRLDLYISHTDSSSGTGHAIVYLEYVEA